MRGRHKQFSSNRRRLISTGSRAVESMIADVNRCWRSDNGLLVVPIRREMLMVR
jgi:hypothetical protein